MMKKVLVLDIDGTLTNSKKQITEATKQAIWKLMDRGHLVALASGRPTPGMRRYERELELDKRGGYLLSYNGAKIVECISGEVVHQNFLPLHVVPELYEFAKERGAGLITYDGDIVISAFDPDEYIKLEAGINWLPIRVQQDFVECVNYDINKCLMTAPGEQAAVYEKELQERFGDIISIYRSEPFFIEIMPKDMNKAVGLDLVLKGLGMGPEQAVCCGDGYNDISMIEYAKVGVAMGNAQPAVKEAADYIAPTNDEDGLVDVISKFFEE
ncbi:MAG: HAD family phosphatase [Lachnospiraceae bacterium]|nr:HAD family phosphatase [Lachnospiraceae bacterium]